MQSESGCSGCDQQTAIAVQPLAESPSGGLTALEGWIELQVVSEGELLFGA